MGDTVFDELMNYRTSSSSANTKEEPKKKIKPSEQLLLDIKDEGFDLSQMEAVLKTRGNQLVISCAGSGKTTVMVFKIIYDLKTGYATRVMETNGNPVRIPEKIWVSTFLKSGAEELKFALRKWQGRLHCPDTSSAIQFSTLHAEFKRALTAMGITTNIVSAKENSNFLKEAVKPYQLINGNGNHLNAEDYRNLEGALTFTRGRLDYTRYIHDEYTDLNIGETIIDAILRDWKALRIKNGVCDFEDLQERLYHECYERNNQEVIDFLSKRYNFIYVDEFQDTSQIQYKLLQIYSMGCKQVMVVGDDDQTIYSWRGSDNKIITKDFIEDFSPTVNMLSVNFRCPSNILDAVKPCIKNNSTRFDKELESYSEGGKVRYLPAANYSKMVSSLSDLIYEDAKNNKSVVILCRVNSDGLMPALILDKLGNFSFSISGDGMTLDSYIGRTVLSIVKLFTEKSTAPVKSALNMLAWDQYGINNLMKVCKANKMSIWTIDEKDLSYSCPSIAERILKWRSWSRSMGEVQALRLVLQDYRTSVFVKDTQFNNVMRSVISSVEALLDYFNYDTVEDFEFELEEINERLKGRIKKNSAKVKIATVHEFKGKEADSVYVWNVSQDVFPYKDSIESEENLEEERRVFYIACTRAKELNTLIFLKNRPSMFLDEMDLSSAEELGLTAGKVSDEIEKNMTQERNIQQFEQKCNSEPDVFLPTNNSSLYEENEFWGTNGEDSFGGIDFRNHMGGN